MKKLFVLSSLLTSLSCLNAANIYWVSLHPADETPTSNAANAGFTNAPDAGYTQLLRSKGHTVTRIVSSGTPDVQSLNAADLVIISRSVPSGHYQNEPSPTDWNGITSPMIVLNGYTLRGSRLGYTTGDTIVDSSSNPLRLRVNTPVHPIFAGVALDANNLMVEPYSKRVTFTNATTGVSTLQNGISVNTSGVVAGGTVLATAGTAGDAAAGGMIIGEFPAGVTTQRGGTFGAKRLVFLSGSRESGIHGDGAGILDLNEDGQKMFLNAVDYLTAKTAPVVSITPLVATNLFPGEIFSFRAAAFGPEPFTYQWYKNDQAIGGAVNTTYDLASATTQDAGDYKVVVTNPYGSATSAVARISFAPAWSPSITNGLVAYWPLDSVVGTKTPDVVSGYDMTLVNMGTTNVVEGRWGNAFTFDGAKTLLERINNSGDDLPVTQHREFTVSLWVKGGVQQDKRVFSEGSTTNSNPMLNIGTHSGGTDGAVDVYIRGDTGQNVGDHRRTTLQAFDWNWHNVVYVQRYLNDTWMKGTVWVDGVLDSVEITPVRPLTAQATAIGAIRRAGASAWYTGEIDEVAAWKRALSPEEIQILQVTQITNPPVRLQPLVINNFRADVPAVVKGGSTTLRWDVSKDAAQVTINPLGDVTAQTVVGIGSRLVTLNETASYVLTVQRGAESLSVTTRVAVVDGIATGWTLLDNFDQYNPGSLFVNKYWNDVTGGSAEVVSVKGNPAVVARSGVSYLDLRNLSVAENQRATLFFRIIAGADGAMNVTNIVGLTDKSQRNYSDAVVNIGPVLYPTPLTNTTFALETNAWHLGARNGSWGNNTSAPIEYPLYPLQAGAVYNVWVDVENLPKDNFSPDVFSVYVQKEGENTRTTLFANYSSDRDLSFVDPILGGIAPLLDKLVVMGNSTTDSAQFDDFYLSLGAYNSTVPRVYGFTGQVQRQPGNLSLGKSGNQLQIQFSSGVLQQAPSLNGPWTDVSGNPTSPYLVTPQGNSMFYRTR